MIINFPLGFELGNTNIKICNQYFFIHPNLTDNYLNTSLDMMNNKDQ